MEKQNDVHYQFADFFKDKELQPFAYLVSKRLQEGHICIDLDKKELAKDYETLPDYFKSEFSELSPDKLMSKNEWVSTKNEIKKPFIISNKKLYLYRFLNDIFLFRIVAKNGHKKFIGAAVNFENLHSFRKHFAINIFCENKLF